MCECAATEVGGAGQHSVLLSVGPSVPALLLVLLPSHAVAATSAVTMFQPQPTHSYHCQCQEMCLKSLADYVKHTHDSTYYGGFILHVIVVLFFQLGLGRGQRKVYFVLLN